MRKLSAFFIISLLLLGCNDEGQIVLWHSEDHSPPETSGEGGNSQPIDAGLGGSGGSMEVDAGPQWKDGDYCSKGDKLGQVYKGICLLCTPGNLVGNVVAGFPMDPDVCWQYKCELDPEDPNYAIHTLHVKSADSVCQFQDNDNVIFGKCETNGWCCTDQPKICGGQPEEPFVPSPP